MGYSCSTAALDSLKAVSAFYATNGNANILTIYGTQYFFERGREQNDGAITGTLFEMLPNDYARKRGTVRIEPDGTITRFPFISKKNVETFRANPASARAMAFAAVI